MTRRFAYAILRVMTPDDLKKWRIEHGYTQVTLAQRLEVDVMTLSRWERGVYEFPGFLRLALERLEYEGGEKKPRDTKTKKERRNK